MGQCQRCRKQRSPFKVRKYNLPNKQDAILCKNCYKEIIRTDQYYQQFQQMYQMPTAQKRKYCPSCVGAIQPDSKVYHYCGQKIRKKTNDYKE